MERKTKQSTVITLLEVFIKAMLFESWFHNSICEKKRSPTNMRHSLTKMADIQVTHASVCATVDWLSARHVNPFEQQRGCRGWLVTWNGGHFPRSSNHRGLRHLCQAADPVDQVVSVGRKYGGEATLRL